MNTFDILGLSIFDKSLYDGLRLFLNIGYTRIRVKLRLLPLGYRGFSSSISAVVSYSMLVFCSSSSWGVKSGCVINSFYLSYIHIMCISAFACCSNAGLYLVIQLHDFISFIVSLWQEAEATKELKSILNSVAT